MNHLLIGLGGTGGRVLCSFSKLVYQAHRNSPPDNVTFDYLHVDSDPKSFRDDDPNWRVLGHSVGLPTRCKLDIRQANLREVIDNLNSHPKLKPWIGDRQSWGEVLASLSIDAAGGQKRRLGRFLFAMSARRFADSVVNLVRDMRARGDRANEITFHIFAGLAGGTGSGSLVDVVAQLRKLFPDPHHRIIVYAYLPDMNPPTNWNTGNYHSNAYAALLELNAMSAGAWAPFDVLDGGGPVQHDFWFNGCYVFTDDNANNFRASIESELTDILADFVYHKIVVARQVAWDELSSFENSENGDGTPEAIAGSGKGQRSLRFLSFGIRRLSFPEETIREYLTYDFVGQSLRQLQFNNWLESEGFADQPRPRADAEFVADPAQQEKWRLTNNHLCLNLPIIDPESAKTWKKFDDEWQQWENHYLTLAKQQGNKVEWLKELKTLFAAAFDNNFRGKGVQQFFAMYDRDIPNLALAIRDRVERSLFEDWEVGRRSLSEAGRVVEALLRDLEARQGGLEPELVRRGRFEEERQKQLSALEKSWTQIGLVGSVLGNYDKALVQAAILLRDLAIDKTTTAALQFAKRLMGQVALQITDLKAVIDSGQAALAAAAEDAMRIMKSRAPSNGAPGPEKSGYIKQIEDSRAIEKVRRRLSLDQDLQSTLTYQVRQGIISELGQQKTFKNFSTRFAGNSIRNVIITLCERNVDEAHQNCITERSDRILGVSIIDKLVSEWGSQERLNKEANALARSAGRFLVFNETEQNKQFEGMSSSPRATEAFAVMLPEPPEHLEFVTSLKDAFRNARMGKVSFIPCPDRGNEITLVTLVNLFPLRFSKVVNELRERYLQRIAQFGKARTMLEVHSEGDGSQFPDLFIPDAGCIREQARPVLLLGEALGVVRQRVSPATGQPQIIIGRKDADGFDLEPIMLGKNFISALEEISERDLYELRQTLRPLLKPPRFSREEEKNDALAVFIARVDAIKGDRLDDVQDSEVVAWNQAARDSMKIVRREKEL